MVKPVKITEYHSYNLKIATYSSYNYIFIYLKNDFVNHIQFILDEEVITSNVYQKKTHNSINNT